MFVDVMILFDQHTLDHPIKDVIPPFCPNDHSFYLLVLHLYYDAAHALVTLLYFPQHRGRNS